MKKQSFFYVEIVDTRIHIKYDKDTEKSMKKAYIYIDNSNLFIEGSRLSLVNKGIVQKITIYEAMNQNLTDLKWRLDYIKLYKTIEELVKYPIGFIKLWGSPPPYDPFWEYIKTLGYEVKIYPKNIAGKEKRVDLAIDHQITKDAYKVDIITNSVVINKAEDEIFLIAGDIDYEPGVEDLTKEGFKYNVIFWEHASNELKNRATSFISLNPYFYTLTLR